MSEQAKCIFCNKEDPKNKMVYQMSLFNDIEKWFHAKCMPVKMNRKKILK